MPKTSRIPWYPTDTFFGSATRELQPDLLTRPRDAIERGADPMAAQMSEWECADCGWNVDATRLLPGWSLQDARLVHAEKYCARPPTWPPS